MLIEVRYYPNGLTEAEQMDLYGTQAELNVRDPYVSLRVVGLGIGAEIPIAEAVRMGLSEKDLLLCKQGPQTFDVKLVRADV